MLKKLQSSLSIYRLKLKMLMLQMQIKKMERAPYLNLWSRRELSGIKTILQNLHEQINAIRAGHLSVQEHHKLTKIQHASEPVSGNGMGMILADIKGRS